MKITIDDICTDPVVGIWFSRDLAGIYPFWVCPDGKFDGNYSVEDELSKAGVILHETTDTEFSCLNVYFKSMAQAQSFIARFNAYVEFWRKGYTRPALYRMVQMINQILLLLKGTD